MSADAVRYRRRFVALSALRWFPTGLAVPVLVLLMRERGLDLATIGVVGAVYSVTILVLELPSGGLADVVGRRPVLLVSSALSLVAALGFAVGASVPALLVAYAVFGVARALDTGPLQSWYVDAVLAIDPRTDLRPALSRAAAAEAAGLGAGAVTAGLLVAVSPFPEHDAVVVALSTPFLVAAAVGAVHLAAVWWWVDERLPVVEGSGEAPTRLRAAVAGVPATIARGLALALRGGPVRRVVLFTLTLGFALAGIELLAPISFAEMLGGEARAATAYSVLVTAGFAGSAAGSALAPACARLLRSSPRAVLFASLAAALALGAVAVPVLGVAAAAFVAFYLLLGVAGPLVDDLTHRAVTATERTTVLSVSSTALQLGGAVVGVGVGALAQSTSVATGLLVVAAVLAAGATAMVRWPGRLRHADDVGG
ncbi:MFS transporter [Isoptericola jiangsuensis]|uniref:MFS transporter n=1 Tax=Isoptericola jiangsuensis TaxID=548579 RepID=UPI003AAA48FA